MKARPFVKWIGGKQAIAADIIERLDLANDDIYYEPFLGGGAVFLELRNRGFEGEAVLSDANGKLITAWRAVQRDVGNLMLLLEMHQEHHTAEHYYKLRESMRDESVWEEKMSITRAAIFIYLNKTCFNGLYRENSKGQFNAALGKTADGSPPVVCDEDNLKAAHEAIQSGSTTFFERDYEETFSRLGEGREGKVVVYCDPPYDATYARYTHLGKFNHRRLAEKATKAANDGARVVVSNSDTELVREIYKDAKIEEIQAPRKVSRTAEGRGKVYELLITLDGR